MKVEMRNQATAKLQPPRLRLIEKAALQRICQMSFRRFRRLGQTQAADGGDRIFIDRGASVLAVAHLDTVVQSPAVSFVNIGGAPHVISGRLDDRLGVYALLELLPKLGIVVDVLLTDNEESGASTARGFVAPRQYNWMFQFDRRGTDVVMYEYETEELRQLCGEVGLDVSLGSFSDICSLSHLGCKGLNFGIAYEREHTHWCNANLLAVESQIYKFAAFYALNKDRRLSHEPRTTWRRRWHRYDDDAWFPRVAASDDAEPDNIGVERVSCGYCREWFTADSRGDEKYCSDCLQYFDEVLTAKRDGEDEFRLFDDLPPDIKGLADDAPPSDLHYQTPSGICCCGDKQCGFSDDGCNGIFSPYLSDEAGEANSEAIKQIEEELNKNETGK